MSRLHLARIAVRRRACLAAMSGDQLRLVSRNPFIGRP